MKIYSNWLNEVGVVVIGRNEGDRLIRCLKSLAAQSNQIVYVDSASTDNSENMAREIGADVVSLDMSIPFTAARARNEGFKKILKLYPQINHVQFVDGDCEIAAGWLEKASQFLTQHQDVAVLSGNLRERFPEQTVYNMLCDFEWDTPVGEAKTCGGISMMRVDAFEAVGGFRINLICGEEPELCERMRVTNRKIWHINEEMALHDAAMTRFGQWWKRSKRAGYAYAEGVYLHGATPTFYGVKESWRAWIWGLMIPVVTASLVIWIGAWGIVMLLTYPVQIIRLAVSGTRSVKENWWLALFMVLGKFPEAIGQLKFIYNKLSGNTARLIEYK